MTGVASSFTVETPRERFKRAFYCAPWFSGPILVTRVPSFFRVNGPVAAAATEATATGPEAGNGTESGERGPDNGDETAGSTDEGVDG